MVLVAGKHTLAGTHHPDEIEGDETTGDAQQQTGRDALYRPLAVEMEGEESRIAAEDIGEAGGCDTRHKDGQHRRHRHVDQQHLDRKHQTCYRRLEDTGDGSCRTTAHQRHQHLTIHVEGLPQIRTDGRARQHDRRFSTHRATETDGDGRGNHRRPTVVRLQSRLVHRDGIEDTGDAVGDIILDDITHEQRGEVDTDDGIDKIEPVGTRRLEATRQQHHYLVDDPVEREGCHSRKETHQQREDEHEHPLADVFDTPRVQTFKESRFRRRYCCLHDLLPDDGNLSVLTQSDDGRGGMGFMFLSTRPTDIIHRIEDALVDVTVVLCRRLATDIRRG